MILELWGTEVYSLSGCECKTAHSVISERVSVNIKHDNSHTMKRSESRTEQTADRKLLCVDEQQLLRCDPQGR